MHALTCTCYFAYSSWSCFKKILALQQKTTTLMLALTWSLNGHLLQSSFEGPVWQVIVTTRTCVQFVFAKW